MIDVVFISDLHLHPEDRKIQERFNQFIEWAKVSVKNIYILGDFSMHGQEMIQLMSGVEASLFNYML